MDKIDYKLLFLSCVIGLPIQCFIMPELLRYVYMPNLLIQVIMYIFISFVIYSLFRGYKKWQCIDRYLLAFIYYFFMVYILFARPDMGYSFYELNPGQLINSIRYGSYDEWIIALFNVLIFIPMPIIHHFFTTNRKIIVLSSTGIGILIEIVQALSHRGVFDVGDIILYIVGIWIGDRILKRFSK